MRTTLLKKLLKTAGIDTHNFLFSVFETNAKSIYYKKLATLDPHTQKIVDTQDESHHLADIEFKDMASQYVVKSFTIDRINFIRKSIPKNAGYAVDLGDTNGLFLKSIGRTGISINISDVAVKKLKLNGYEAIKADIQYLPFKNESIQTMFLFETLEHMPNPVATLIEIGRVCSGSLILSIPCVSSTQIHSYGYDPKRPIFQHHIFEFNHEDFKKIITHTPFSVYHEEIAEVIDDGRRIFDRFILFFWSHLIEKDTFCGCFKKFSIYHLKKIRSGNEGTDIKR
jgi:hypothetical protein